MDKKRLAINMTAQILAFLVNLGISFLLAPVIDAGIQDGYGYWTLANKFVLYAQIVISALNTMASRFITIRLHRGDDEGANGYFSSVFFGNILMAVIFMVPALVIILFAGQLFQVPGRILTDVQLLWLFVFGNFFLSIITSVFGVAPYSKDRLDLTSMATIVSEALRAGILIFTYAFFTPYLWYVGMASLVATLVLSFANVRFTRYLLPQIRIQKKYFDWKKVKELMALGAWNSVTRLGQVLLDSVDELIALSFLGSSAMTTIGLAKNIPTTLSGLMGTVVGVFNPQITMAYAEGNKERLLDLIKSSNRIMIYLLSIPISFVVVYGDIFFRIWMRHRDDTRFLYELAVLSMMTLFISASIQVLYHVFIITKRVKLNSIVMVASGVLTTAIVFILLNTTNLGLYAIAGVSSVIGIIRNLFFTPIYASKCLKVKWNTFYGDIGMGLLSMGCIGALAYVSRVFILQDSWMNLIVVGCLTGLLSLVVNFFIILRRHERDIILDKLRDKLSR